MKTTLPSELWQYITAIAKAPAIRLLSRAFLAIANAALVDSTATRFDLALKGDLFSIVVRFGGADDTVPLREACCIRFYQYYKYHKWADGPFGALVVVNNDEDNIPRVFEYFTRYNIAFDQRQYNIYKLRIIVEHLGVDVTKHAWFIAELDKLADDCAKLNSDKTSSEIIMSILDDYISMKPIANKIRTIF